MGSIGIPASRQFCWLLAVMVAGFQFGPIAPHYLKVFQGQAPYVEDFAAYHFGASIYLHGASPYDPVAVAAMRESAGPNVFPFTYPPFSLLFFAPLATLPYGASLIVFQLSSCLALMTLVYVLLSIIEQEGLAATWGAAMVGTFACYHAIATTIGLGQINFFAAALIAIAWYRARTFGPNWSCAALLTAATVLKTYPALLIFVFLLRRDYRTFTQFCAMIVSIILLALVLVPVSTGRIGLPMWHRMGSGD